METKCKKSLSSCLQLATLLIILLLLEELSSNARVVAAQNSFDVVVAAQNSFEFGQFNGSVAECGENGEEMEMESSEISRRFLHAAKYISPGALKPNLPFCGNAARGEPYSNSCLPPPSNALNRGCSKYYRCRK
uniref:Uncharacterized protein n=1 Tax=Davidia involucrata TaxID=16924 RepID=A0A5B7BMV2_DAVIN